ncbi:MAG: acetyl-CoA carboxylase carboxyltransferase subunit alpha [Limnochordia bacterium]|jgi:acetyl-CoA carboxylase carboxyl transferase subunit alpha|nr:acetyl-CoA carboxylase carboxyltransferase subunit alpha [Bacillota bacterium]HOB09364.1 acetyl-CoA carboxylase carboxyltransferase subunit alpha [Limnochordia bacterium]NLH31394.1 acetyl-CoA carboxylase carboxyltransferase subunit alpha [Bacillota bacterium]HPT93355.1 acetyl-CoA carboxylase carboxyltransferase subunit alpha [Limnochordia bacterium]HPZ30460.1 acetyl-CoA carboxylase carboxyltransferase subunit alpha [Limnochordia bacterium]
MPTVFEWEKPLVELEEKINELRNFIFEQGIDFKDELNDLERKADKLRKEIYERLTPWQRVRMARHPDRPTTLDYIKLVFDDFFELHGDRRFGDDHAIVGGIAVLDGEPVTVIGPQKGRDTKENITRNFGLPHPEGYRKALRLMQQAERFHRPIITLIDVVGAYPGIEAEQRGQGLVIAECIEQMSFLKVPIVCIITGEGGSGGALAIGVGDRILMMEHAWYSVISPEMCATILWKDANRASEAAELLKLTSTDLLKFGIIDDVITEPLGGAHRDHEGTGRQLKAFLRRHLSEIKRIPPDELVKHRLERFRKIGEYQAKKLNEMQVDM